MNKKLLNKLKELQKNRGDTSAFSNHDEFLPWSDNVMPLLEFDEKLQKTFEFWTNHVKSAYRMGRDHNEALGEAIGVVNQAVAKLELKPEIETIEKTKIPKEISYPHKITLSWIYKHAPLRFWSYLFALLITAFLFGVYVSQTPLYDLLMKKSSGQ